MTGLSPKGHLSTPPRSGMYSSRSEDTPGNPRTSDVLPITRLTRLGIMVESRSA